MGFLSCATCSCTIRYPENGSFSGYVTQVWEQTNVTWDSTIVEAKTGAQSPDKYKMCVKDEVVLNKLKEALRNKKEITLYFERDSYIMWNWECNGADYIATKVE